MLIKICLKSGIHGPLGPDYSELILGFQNCFGPSLVRPVFGSWIPHWSVNHRGNVFTGSIKLPCNLWLHNTPHDKSENSSVVLISARLHFEGFQWARIGWSGQPIRWKKFWNLPFWLFQDMIGYLWIPLQELIKYWFENKVKRDSKRFKIASFDYE